MRANQDLMKGIKSSGRVNRSSVHPPLKHGTQIVQEERSQKHELEVPYINRRPRRIRFSDQGTSASILFKNKAGFKPSAMDLSNEQYLNTIRARSYTPPSRKGESKHHYTSDPKKRTENPITTRAQTLKEVRDLLSHMLDDPNKSEMKEAGSPKSLLADMQSLEDLLDREEFFWAKYNSEDQFGAHYSEGSTRPYWIGPDTGKKTCIPPTPLFIRKLRIRPQNDAMTRLKRFRENEEKRYTRERALFSRAKTSLLKYERTLPITALYHHKYDTDLVQILRDEEEAAVLTKKQRADMREELKKRDELLAYELDLLKQTKENIMKRCSKFKTVADAYRIKVYEPEKAKKLKGEELTASGSAILYGEGLTLAIERRESLHGGSLVGHFGSASSTTLSTRARPAHRCKKYRNLAIFTTSGQVTGSDDEPVFARLFQKLDRHKLRKVKTYHCLVEARHQLQKEARLNAKKDGNQNKVEITEAPIPIEFLKDPRPTEREAESEDERVFTEEDLQFLREIREKHHINEGDCGLIHPDIEIHPTLQQIRMAEHNIYHYSAFSAPESHISKSDPTTFLRKTPFNIEEQLKIERRRNYNIAMSVFPRRGPGVYTTCKDPFQPEFWTGFCINKYNLEKNAGPIDPQSGIPKFLDFFRHLFQVQRLEDAHPLDKSPEVLYYRLLPSQLGLVGVPDPDPDELFPKPLPGKTAFNYISTNSPASSFSPEPIIFANEQFGLIEKESTTPTDHKNESERYYGPALRYYPFKRMMDKLIAFKEKQDANQRLMEQKMAEIMKTRQVRKLNKEPDIPRKLPIEIATVGRDETLRQIRLKSMANAPFAHHTDSLIYGRSRCKSFWNGSRQSRKSVGSHNLHSLSKRPRGTKSVRSYASSGTDQ